MCSVLQMLICSPVVQSLRKPALDMDDFVAIIRLFESASLLHREIKTFFEVVDTDGSGGISLSELIEVQRYLGAQALSAEAVAKILTLFCSGDSGADEESEVLKCTDFFSSSSCTCENHK